MFVLQVAGDKCWRIHERVHPSPLRDQPWTDRRTAVEEAAGRPALLDETLRPGDCLYLPRGYLHAAKALGDVSTHLTIGVHPWTRRHLADELVGRAVVASSEDERVRASLGLGVDLADPAAWEGDVDIVREALVRALRDVAAETLADALGLKWGRAQRAAPVSPVATVRAAAALDGSERLLLRRHLEARVDGERVHSRAGELLVDSTEQDSVAALVTTGSASVSELGIDLARRLLLGGVVTLEGALPGVAADELSHP